MPLITKKPCAHRGCRELVRGVRYCKEHELLHRQNWGQRIQTDFKPFYDSKAWRECRKNHIREYPFCNVCGDLGEQVDHLIPLMKGGEPFDDSNLQTLCCKCHSKKTYYENLKKGKARVEQGEQ